MTRWTSDPEAAAAALMADALSEIDVGDRVLLAGGEASLVSRLVAPERTVTRWSRRVQPQAIVQPEPPAGPYTAALLRLPKSRDEQLMAAHQCLGALAPDGRLIVYGGNDEGIRTFLRTLGKLGAVTTLTARGHGRIIALGRRDVSGVVAPRLADWRQQADAGRSWTSFPGLFAAGTPDPGTALLLAHLPALPGDANVLDYGAGPGAIAEAIGAAQPSVRLTLLDNDSVALVAAATNVPSAKAWLLGDSLQATGDSRFQMIVSNPPLHVGFKEDLSALLCLIAEAPDHLAKTGVLLLVVQRRIALERTLAASFSSVSTLADDGRYRVWRATNK